MIHILVLRIIDVTTGRLTRLARHVPGIYPLRASDEQSRQSMPLSFIWHPLIDWSLNSALVNIIHVTWWMILIDWFAGGRYLAATLWTQLAGFKFQVHNMWMHILRECRKYPCHILHNCHYREVERSEVDVTSSIVNAAKTNAHVTPRLSSLWVEEKWQPMKFSAGEVHPYFAPSLQSFVA